MARANLGQLLGNVGETTTAIAPEPTNPEKPLDKAPPVPPPTLVPAVRPQRLTANTAKQTAEPVAADPPTPTYLRYVRKETRLREDQQNRLTQQARRLNRAKSKQGARITENSLIRIAVDLFLAQVDRAAGDDEDTIRKSLTP